MSAAAATSIAAALWPAMRRIVRAIGRWVIRQIREHGAETIAGYMRVRIGVFKRRLGRARSDRRKRWLRGRIRRWRRAAKWIADHARRLNPLVADALERQGLAERIPERSPLERCR